MRRALRSDADGFAKLQIEAALRPMIEKLIRRYEYDAYRPQDAADAPFVIAALHYLLGNTDGASEALARAIEAGDHAVSTENLKRLIDTLELSEIG